MPAVMLTIKNTLETYGIVKPEEFLGCSEQEIEEIMRAQNVAALPSVYLDFLRIMGKGAGEFMQELEIFYPDVVSIKDYVLKEIVNNQRTNFKLPDTAFVFMMNQGYEFLYFDTNNVDGDPPVYHYIEGDGSTLDVKPFKQWERISEFFEYESNFYVRNRK
jgi:hypothetical protein